ncbi:MAG: hypothetical protein ABR958_00545 [Dehalococcoidales bacterium]
MARLKYSKYFLNELTPEERYKGYGKMPSMVTFTDHDIIAGSYYFSAMVMGPRAIGRGHGPHTHKDPEILVALGTDPDHPEELGAEIELCMGPEMEKHIITTSTLVFIPANFVHCPFRVMKVTRPFLFIQSQYAPKLTETALKKLLARAERDKMIFLDADGTQKD